jgi:hypothetical protein
MIVAVLDPNVLNFYVLLGPAMALVSAVAITSVGVMLSLMISRSFFKSYSFSGFGYLLGLPVGFAFLGASYLFELASVAFQSDPTLHPAFFWIQMLLQAEAFALIALSYYYKTAAGERGRHVSRDLLIAVIPLLMIGIPFLIPTSVLVAEPYFNYADIADLSFYMRLVNLIVLGYIFRSALISLIRSANIKNLYVPAAFALLALEQYSLIMAYFDNSAAAFIGSLVARGTGLLLFAYSVHRATSRRRLELEARKAT